MTHPKSREFANTIFNICDILFATCNKTNDKTLRGIATLILRYLFKILDNLGLKTRDLTKSQKVDMGPFYEYISQHNIKFLDLNTLSMEDLDMSNDDDVEIFVLSHIHYIIQNN